MIQDGNSGTIVVGVGIGVEVDGVAVGTFAGTYIVCVGLHPLD